MNQFTTAHPIEPKEITEKQLTIRNKSDWTAVFDQLESAKESYETSQGLKGGFRKAYRRFAQHVAQPLLGATRFIPDIDYITPVLGIVQISADKKITQKAAKTAADVRETVLGVFDDIDMKFSQIELFLETFPEDINIENASVDLIADVFRAVESVILFSKRTWKRFASATFKTSEEYQREIINSLDNVD
ncbi:hypothetical protein B0T17DRAFT_620599 [Bombardia bombarda]|uniref:Uncharacterized protein n=1 Tax=Bombardia bombarda TaxID=252184 RepID=A0AA39TPH9_9PEZI|nr:hypothetical protein B0T17DRAFT_620599 [Bombardia bombarda]